LGPPSLFELILSPLTATFFSYNNLLLAMLLLLLMMMLLLLIFVLLVVLLSLFVLFLSAGIIAGLVTFLASVLLMRFPILLNR